MRRGTLTLREIAAVRHLQREMAGAKAARAVRQCDKAQDEHAARERARDDAEEGWRAGMFARTVSLELVGLWSELLLRQEAAVDSAEQDVAHARQLRDSRRADWSDAVVRADRADAAAADAFRKELEERDDEELQNALDRHRAGEGSLP